MAARAMIIPVSTAAAILIEEKGPTQDAMRAKNRCLQTKHSPGLPRPETSHFRSFSILTNMHSHCLYLLPYLNPGEY